MVESFNLLFKGVNMNTQLLLLVLKLGRYGFWILAVSLLPLFLTSTTASLIIAAVLVYLWLDVAVTLFYHRKLGMIEYNNSVLLWPFK